MKKLILIVFLLGVILGVTGCQVSNTDISDIKISNPDDISFFVKEETLKNTGATLVLENNSDKLLRYDEVYEIEVKRMISGTK